MTLHLILTRHAKSDWSAPTGLDHDRPLNARGRRDAPKMGAWVAGQDMVPDQVLCSDAARTRETLALMMEAWRPAPEVRYVPQLYHAEPAMMRKVLNSATGQKVAMIGHNPGIAWFAASLADRPPTHPRWDDYPTAATTIFAFEAENWSEVARGQVTAFAIPADL